MSIEMLSPGVYSNEVDYSDYVASASTCIIGMVGEARRGPTSPTLVTDQKQFEQLFGKPTPGSYGAYSALMALTRSNQLYYQRVVHESSRATAGVVGNDKLTFTMINTGSKYNDYYITTVYRADNDLDIKLMKNATEPSGTATEVEVFNHVSTDPDNVVTDGISTIKVNSQSKYFRVVNNSKGVVSAKNLAFTGGTDGASKGVAGTAETPFLITTKYYDSTLNYALVKFSKPDAFGYFNMELLAEDGVTVIESLNNMTLDTKDERFIELLAESGSRYIDIKYNPSANKEHATDTYTIMGGSDGIKGITIDEIKAGLEQFSNPEVLDINLLTAPGWYQAEVTNKGTQVCAARDDAFYIAGTPFGLNPQRANDWADGTGEFATDHAAFDTSYGAIYWPWVRIYDQYTRRNIYIPPEGAVVAQYAYSDSVKYPWFAPAGLNRGIITSINGLEYTTTKGERDAIYGNRHIINNIMNYRGQGFVIWGQKTMQRKTSALDRINVRRLINYVKKIINAATAYYVFDDNSQYQWNKWIDMVEPKLANIKENRGITDYKIEMKPTIAEIENNQMPGRIYIKPTKTSEFIPIDYVITNQSEILHDQLV